MALAPLYRDRWRIDCANVQRFETLTAKPCKSGLFCARLKRLTEPGSKQAVAIFLFPRSRTQSWKQGLSI